ncbi:hypothetical protein [Marinobacter sp. F3R08]|uniref:hypothetical protein n=1 Tax=Marinobacter sp. F3R08 TaxID=2841559 RepID=UPI001C09C58B|nr:hypothetical protein [Marinobacter sp. F3R08]MBU2952277.1 hypothetical protein [Marinobacter sp. F3R08]
MNNSQFETKLTIRWWANDESNDQINESDKGSLFDYSMDVISSMVSSGLTEGDLGITVIGDEHCAYLGYWEFKEQTNEAKTYSLPFGVNLQISSDGAGQMSSELAKQFSLEDGLIDEKGEATADALEALLLAMGCAGVDLDDPKIVSALTSAVDQIGQNM